MKEFVSIMTIMHVSWCCGFSMILPSCLQFQLMKRKRVRCNKEKTPLGNEVNGLAQVFMVIGKRVAGARQNLVSIKARRDIHHDGLFDLSVFLLCF